ncbi:MAG: hypothetical protein ACREIW_05835 [Chthoniobacterales bacterium]
MKKKFVMMLAALVAVSMLINPSAKAISFNIDVGDRPYYEGRTYWDNGYEFVWIAGHREHGHWVHGRYERHGEFHREHAREHHHRHHD